MEAVVDQHWRKSTRSGNGGGNCVEVATQNPGTIAVRDSKNPHGPVLATTPEAWTRFLTRLQTTG